MSKISYARHRFPSSIIQRAVWLYFRFTLSFRDIEDVLADITPPVALAAYAAAGIAGANPFRTGNTAFRLGIAKALVPFVFVYSPALLIITDGFTWTAFAVTMIGAMIGIAGLGVAFSGFFLTHLSRLERWWIGLVSLLFVAPGLTTMGVGALLWSPIVILQFKNRSKGA